MKYIHPKLWREAIKQGTNYYIRDGKWVSVPYTLKEIEGLWFEPTQEVPEWIAKILQQFQIDSSDPEYNVFAKAILDNMPKSKKVEENDIRDFVLERHLSFENTEAIKQFLIYFNLLDQ